MLRLLPKPARLRPAFATPARESVGVKHVGSNVVRLGPVEPAGLIHRLRICKWTPIFASFIVARLRGKMVHAALLLLMLEAVTADLVFTISLKRSTQNLQLSTSSPADYPIFLDTIRDAPPSRR